MAKAKDHPPSVDWLPASALDDGAIADWVKVQLGHWARAWFGSSKAESVTLSDMATPDTPITASHSNGVGSGLMANGDARLWLANECLDASPAEIAETAKDREFIGDLVDHCLVDLMTRLSAEDAEGETGFMPIMGHRYFNIQLGETTSLTLALSRSCCVQIRKMICAVSTDTAPLAQNKDTAFEAQTVRLQAEVGRLKLSVNGLADLSPGDVITFDRTIADGFPLLVDGKRCVGLQARFILTQAKKRAHKKPGIILESTDG